MWQVLCSSAWERVAPQADTTALQRENTAQPPRVSLQQWVCCKVSLYIKGKAFLKKASLPSHIKQLSWITAHFCVRTFTVHLSPTSNMGFRTAVCEHKDYIWWSVLTCFLVFWFFFSFLLGFNRKAQFSCDTCGRLSLKLVLTDESCSHPGRVERREQNVRPRRKVTLI